MWKSTKHTNFTTNCREVHQAESYAANYKSNLSCVINNLFTFSLAA